MPCGWSAVGTLSAAKNKNAKKVSANKYRRDSGVEVKEFNTTVSWQKRKKIRLSSPPQEQ